MREESPAPLYQTRRRRAAAELERSTAGFPIRLSRNWTGPNRRGTVCVAKNTTPRHNHLLDRLAPDDFVLLRPHLQEVKLGYLDPIADPGRPIEFVYFPLSGVASLAKTMANGAAAEVGATGNAGYV